MGRTVLDRIGRFFTFMFFIEFDFKCSSLQTKMGRLQKKIAVVTASTDGIGLAIAKRFAQEGAKVIISSRNQENVDVAVAKLAYAGLHVIGLVCDVANAEQRKRLLEEAEKLGGLDILVSNASINLESGPVFSCSESDWDTHFEVNVKASFLLAKEALQLLRKRGGGRIIFISSAMAFSPDVFIGAYSVSKTALLGLTRAAAMELAPDNITVNCVAPGLIDTNFGRTLMEIPNLKEVAVSLTPMARLGLPTEVSGVVTFLASEDASYITGETLVAAGGMHSRL